MIDWSQAAVGLLAVVLSAALGWPLTSGVLHMAARSADADADPDEDARHGDDDGGGRRGRRLLAPRPLRLVLRRRHRRVLPG